MIWTNIKRVFRSGFVNFWRNGFISFSSVLVMIITLLFIGSLVFANAVMDSALNHLQDKVDVNIYFYTTSDEGSILALKKKLESLPEVKQVTYISRDEALKKFRETHARDSNTTEVLDLLGDNPLEASLNVRAQKPGQYQSIVELLSDKNGLEKDVNSIIRKTNYNDNKTAIENLSSFVNLARKVGLALTIVLFIISIVITLNTIRLTIYVSREEIAVMRLVGAGYQYIRGPFVVSGILYGAIAGIVTLLIFYPVTLWMKNLNVDMFLGLDLLNYYFVYFGQLFLILVGSGIVIGAVSSYIAVRRYLKV